ncbi:MAG TPA: tRNA epoxyqueuosine(34) reductase QueG [Vicinamibacterales bacterium]|nr:tRNA epoxyqueuosine(34) reductase QueG [Vicinamibacterales bacterium]
MAEAVRTVTAGEIKARARALGFDLCGIAPAVDLPELRFLAEWLARGCAGEMAYLHRSADRRRDVRHVLPSARAVIVLATLYNVDRSYSIERSDAGKADIARYAWGDDYHIVIGHRLDGLIAWLGAEAGQGFEARGYVDTGPVQERVYARHAGLGWIGKNTCLINPDRGSWFFLSEIICNLDLTPDTPALDQCGSCTRCLDACPTGALVEPYVLDSTRCLSYLTIELKGEIPAAQRDGLGAHAYGCDICQEVCPWNFYPAVSQDRAWTPRPGLDVPRLVDLWRLADDELRALLKGSAMKRAGVRRLRRNLAVAIGNTGEPGDADALREHQEPTCGDPLVAEHVRWAVAKLSRDRGNQESA